MVGCQRNQADRTIMATTACLLRQLEHNGVIAEQGNQLFRYVDFDLVELVREVVCSGWSDFGFPGPVHED